MAIFQAPFIAHMNIVSRFVQLMIYYFVERAGERERMAKGARYATPTAFAVGTVIIKATVAALLAQKYIISIFNGPSTPLLHYYYSTTTTTGSPLISFCFQPLFFCLPGSPQSKSVFSRFSSDS